jgi:hypothetical protein
MGVPQTRLLTIWSDFMGWLSAQTCLVALGPFLNDLLAAAAAATFDQRIPCCEQRAWLSFDCLAGV